MKLQQLLVSLILITGCQQATKQPAIPTDSIQTIQDTSQQGPTDEPPPSAIQCHDVISTDLNSDGKPDTITLSSPPAGDPGTFQTIEIALNGGDRKIYNAADAWDTIDADFLQDNHNAVHSPLVFVYKDDQQFAILLFGFVFGAGRGEFNIIYGKNAHFKMVLNDAFEYPMKLQDLNHNGQLTLLGRRTVPEYYSTADIDSLGNVNIGTYAPYAVLNIKADTAIQDPALTREYNEQNYLWLGPDYNEKVKVYYPRIKHKPVLAE